MLAAGNVTLLTSVWKAGKSSLPALLFAGRREGAVLLGRLPERGDHWLQRVNAALTVSKLAAVRASVVRGAPLGDESWRQQTAERLGLESTLRPRGRPRKSADRKNKKGQVK